MLRKSLTTVSLIGLLLSAGLWIGSFHHVRYNGEGWSVFTLEACIHCNWGTARLPTDDHDVIPGIPKFKTGFKASKFLGFKTSWWPYPSPKRLIFWGRIDLGLPLWIPTSLFASAFVFSHFTGRRRRKRKKLGLCVKCGYDLRGSTERCPECGREFD